MDRSLRQDGLKEIDRLKMDFLHAAEILRAKFPFRRVECNDPNFRVREIFSKGTESSGRSVKGTPLLYHQASQSSLSLCHP